MTAKKQDLHLFLDGKGTAYYVSEYGKNEYRCLVCPELPGVKEGEPLEFSKDVHLKGSWDTIKNQLLSEGFTYKGIQQAK